MIKENPYFNKLLRILTTRCMEQAVYFGSGDLCEVDYHHYGLATPIYTHFTSPIRRYADVVVHRELASAIGLQPLPHDYEDKVWMRALTINLNKRHVMSQLAGRASVTLHTHIFFKVPPAPSCGCGGIPPFAFACAVLLCLLLRRAKSWWSQAWS